jgi:predicted nucleotidyltransferase
METRAAYPTYGEIRARQLAARRARAVAAARAASVAAAALGARVRVFGSLVEGRFHRDSDLDLAVEGPAERLAEVAAEVVRVAALQGVAVDVTRLDHAPPRLAARIREHGVDPAALE